MEQGTYKKMLTDKEINFYSELGVPKAMLESMRNTCWCMTLRKAGDGRWVTTEMFEERPELMRTDTFQEGKTTIIENHPFFGGRSEVTMKRRGENMFECMMKTETYGDLSWTETYDENGLTYRMRSSKTKKDIEGKAERVIKLPGWYRCVKGENVKNFFKALGYQENIFEGQLDLVEHVDVQGDMYRVTEYFKGAKNVFKYKLDEESECCYSGMPVLDRKTITTQIGNGKYKSIFVGKKGEKEEWTMQFSDEGLFLMGVDMKSGQTCKMWFERFVQTNGKFKILATSGVDKMGKMMGMDSDLISKICNDFEAVLCISEKDGVVTYNFDSKHMPKSGSFKWNEEFETKHPKIPGTFKCIETKEGDTVTSVSMNDKFKTKSTMKFTDNFAIQTSELVGTGVMTKVIYERIE